MRLWHDFLDLIYPRPCLACDEILGAAEKNFCTTCKHKLLPLDLHFFKENVFTRHFWGRTDIFTGAALFTFGRSGLVQRMVHKIKYEGQTKVAVEMGRRMGELLVQSPYYRNIDFIVPVPLHSRKLKERGYNQSTLLAQGLTHFLKGEIKEDAVKRIVLTESQTKKNRRERIANVLSAFEPGDVAPLTNKSVLLVDDVLTTGATLEACALSLKDHGIRLSMATLAIGNL